MSVMMHIDVTVREAARYEWCVAAQRRRALTPEQAEALRPLVERLCEGRGAMSRLAEATGWKPANIVAYRRGGQGLSFAVALQICAIANEDVFTLLGLP